MINNVRIGTRKKKLELENTNFLIDPKYVDSSCIATCKHTYDNYTKGKCLIVV